MVVTLAVVGPPFGVVDVKGDEVVVLSVGLDGDEVAVVGVGEVDGVVLDGVVVVGVGEVVGVDVGVDVAAMEESQFVM